MRSSIDVPDSCKFTVRVYNIEQNYLSSPISGSFVLLASSTLERPNCLGQSWKAENLDHIKNKYLIFSHHLNWNAKRWGHMANNQSSILLLQGENCERTHFLSKSIQRHRFMYSICLSIGKFKICDHQRGGRCLVFVHQDCWKGSHSKAFVGKNQITIGLHESFGDSVWATWTFSKVFDS